ncbi:hypothetical protein AB837_00488 [bacterium AB1]|nr:hypothetical protein AB837_00488 [bacterium AB1]
MTPPQKIKEFKTSFEFLEKLPQKIESSLLLSVEEGELTEPFERASKDIEKCNIDTTLLQYRGELQQYENTSIETYDSVSEFYAFYKNKSHDIRKNNQQFKKISDQLMEIYEEQSKKYITIDNENIKLKMSELSIKILGITIKISKIIEYSGNINITKANIISSKYEKILEKK